MNSVQPFKVLETIRQVQEIPQWKETVVPHHYGHYNTNCIVWYYCKAPTQFQIDSTFQFLLCITAMSFLIFWSTWNTHSPNRIPYHPRLVCTLCSADSQIALYWFLFDCRYKTTSSQLLPSVRVPLFHRCHSKQTYLEFFCSAKPCQTQIVSEPCFTTVVFNRLFSFFHVVSRYEV